jgi:hypothetical protein
MGPRRGERLVFLVHVRVWKREHLDKHLGKFVVFVIDESSLNVGSIAPVSPSWRFFQSWMIKRGSALRCAC